MAYIPISEKKSGYIPIESKGFESLAISPTMVNKTSSIAVAPNPTAPSFIGGLAKSVFQGIARKGAAIEQTVQQQITGEKQFIPRTPLEKAILGEEPIGNIIEEGRKTLASLGVVEKYQKGLPGIALGVPAFVGSLALDLWGGSKTAFNAALKATRTAEEATSILRNAKVPEEFIKIYAPKFGATKDIKIINEGVASLEKAIETTKVAQKPLQNISKTAIS